MQIELHGENLALPWILGFVGLLVVAVIFSFYADAVAVFVVGMVAARLRWRRVRFHHYFTTRRIILPVLLLVTGIGAQLVFGDSSAIKMANNQSVGMHMLQVFVGSALAVVAGAAVVAIFFNHAGDKMKSIFQLVPADQQGELDEFLGRSAPAGKFADFSQLDQPAVTTEIKQRVIGQDAIVDQVVTTAFRRARLKRKNKPVATFLFVGATGSGKTELAKALTRSLYGDDGKLIRVDCSELSSEYSASRLVGPPPGYHGHDEGSAFCREIGRLGTGVILLDEIEKAHPVVLRVLMSLLDEGRITEQSTSQTYSAQGFLVVMTSNAAAREIAQIVDAGSDDDAEKMASVKDALKQAGFLPEILGRIDAVFPFGNLSRSDVAEVVGLFLHRFAKEAEIELASVDAALLIDLVMKQEKMKDYGIREVVRAVEQAVVDGLLDARDAGFDKAAIRVHGETVMVEGVR